MSRMVDGYRVHVNPDGSAIFLEGFSTPRAFLLGHGAASAINKCYIRRGLNNLYKKWSGAGRLSDKEKIELRKLGKLVQITKMEHTYSGEPDW